MSRRNNRPAVPIDHRGSRALHCADVTKARKNCILILTRPPLDVVPVLTHIPGAVPEWVNSARSRSRILRGVPHSDGKNRLACYGLIGSQAITELPTIYQGILSRHGSAQETLAKQRYREPSALRKIVIGRFVNDARMC
jgi:hypothetical protein